jgi:hypothetical protein
MGSPCADPASTTDLSRDPCNTVECGIVREFVKEWDLTAPNRGECAVISNCFLQTPPTRIGVNGNGAHFNISIDTEALAIHRDQLTRPGVSDADVSARSIVPEPKGPGFAASTSASISGTSVGPSVTIFASRAFGGGGRGPS